MAACLVCAAAGLRWGGAGWAILIGAIYAVGVDAAGAMERQWGHDPKAVVIDEALGYLVSVAGLPASAATATAGLLLFRLLDVVKPPPARQSERLPGGWGIMTDDLVAGAYANLLLRAGRWVLNAWAAS